MRKFEKQPWMIYTNDTMNYDDIIKAGGKDYIEDFFDELSYISGLDDFNMNVFIKFDFDDSPYIKFYGEGIIYNSDYPTNKDKSKFMAEIEETLKDNGFEEVEAVYYRGNSNIVGSDGADVRLEGEYHFN